MDYRKDLLCKAKCQDKWIEGYYSRSVAGYELPDCHVIIDNKGKQYKIDPKTICRYIGDVDENIKLFENDLIIFENCLYKMVYNTTDLTFFRLKNDMFEGLQYFFISEDEITKYKIIGNFIDNPEIWEDGKHILELKLSNKGIFHEYECKLTEDLDELSGIKSEYGDLTVMRHYVLIEDRDIDEKAFPIRVPGGTVGSIHLNDDRKIIEIRIDTDYVIKSYPENIKDIINEKYVGKRLVIVRGKRNN